MEKILPTILLNKYFLKNYKKIEFENIDNKIIYCYAKFRNSIHQFRLKFTLQRKYIFYTLKLEVDHFLIQNPKGYCISWTNSDKDSASWMLELCITGIDDEFVKLIMSEIREISYNRLFLTIWPHNYTYSTNMKYEYINTPKKQKIYCKSNIIFNSLRDNSVKFNRIKII